jgi:hypothetical protein
MPKKLRPAVDLMAFKCRTLKVKEAFVQLVNAPRQTTETKEVKSIDLKSKVRG